MEELFYRGIRQFNEGKFFEAHDSLEEVWHGYRASDRTLLQGLIQASVGLYHLENRNFRGARSQLSKACSKLEAYQPHHWGLSIGHLLTELRCQLALVETEAQHEGAGMKNIDRPKIQLLSGMH